MPGMDGFEAIRRLKALPRGPSTPVLAVSASAMAASRQEALEAGADRFLAKPFQAAELLADLWELLRLAAPPEEGAPAPALPEAAPAVLRVAPALADQLRRAAVLANYDAIVQLIAPLAAAGDPAAARLEGYIEHFDYPGLVRFLDTLEAHHD